MACGLGRWFRGTCRRSPPDLAGDVAGCVGAEVGAGGGDIGWGAGSAEWDHGSDDVNAGEVVGGLNGARHGGVDETGCDGWNSGARYCELPDVVRLRACGGLLVRAGRRGHLKLLVHPELVEDLPLLDDPTVHEPVDDCGRQAHRTTGRCHVT